MALLPSRRAVTLLEVKGLLDAGVMTSTQLVHTYLTRIAEIDHNFNSVIEINTDAIINAQARDAECDFGMIRSNLHGLPTLLKDNVPTLDTTETTCGSLALVGTRTLQEAAVVTALRNSGAIVLGKANMAEWVGFRSRSSCSGWYPRGGQTDAPYAKGSKASRSLSGSAVATALGLCFAALGTETCWSIVSPAEKSGMVGYKPTKDLIPSDGIIYARKKQDTVGLLTRTVKDALLITDALVAATGGSEASLLPPKETDSTDYAGRTLDAIRSTKSESDLSGLRIINQVNMPRLLEHADFSSQESQVVLDTAMKIAINDDLSNLHTNPQNVENLQDLIDFTKTYPEEAYPACNVAGFERAQATDPSSELYKAMLEVDECFARCISNALDQYGCEVPLIPFLSPALQIFAAKAGSLVLSVPLGIFPEETPVVVDPKNGLITEAPGLR